jgi:hypothetical protein
MDVRVEVHTSVGARRRDVGLSASGAGVEEGGPWVTIDCKSGCSMLGTPADTVATLGGALLAAYVLVVTRAAAVFDRRGAVWITLDIDDFVCEVPLVVMGDNSNQLVHRFPSLLILDGKRACGDVLCFLVQQRRDFDTQVTAAFAKVSLFVISLEWVTASTAFLRMLMEGSQETMDLVVELLWDGAGCSHRSRSSAVCVCSGHDDWLWWWRWRGSGTESGVEVNLGGDV